MADRQRLQQVLLNLLSNAVKYNREGGTVTSRARRRDGRVPLAVADTGPGIAQAMPRGSSRRSIASVQERIEGTGLGLALSKGLVELMGGTLTAESTLGVGSTFSLELPVAEAPWAAPSSPRTWRRRRDAAGRARCSTSRTTCRISAWSSDHHPPAGVKLLSAVQGGRASSWRESSAAAIVLDLHLPDIGGEVLARLRADPGTREIPVVILSADATPGQTARLLAGCPRLSDETTIGRAVPQRAR